MEFEKNIKKMYLFNFFHNLHFMGAVLVPFFMTWGGLSYIQMMFLQSWFVIWITILEVPTGTIADHFGRKTSIAIGAFVNALAVILYTIYPNFYLFLIAEFLWALSFTLISGADEALVYDSLKEVNKERESKKVLGKYSSFALIAIVIATFVGGFIANFGLKYPILVMFIPMTIAGLIALSIKEPHFKRQEKNYFVTLFTGVRYFLEHKELKILAFDSVSISVISFMIIWTYQPLLLDLGLAVTLLGIVHSVSTLLEVIIQNNFGKLEKMVGSKKNYLFITAIIIGIGFILLSMSKSLWLSIPVVTLIFGIGFTRRTLIRNYMHKYIESKNRATVLSSISMIDSLGRAFMYPVVGFLAGISLHICLIILGILVLIFSVFSRVEEMHLVD